MSRLDIVLLNLKLLTAIAIGVLSITSAKSYRRRHDPSMAFLSAGLATMAAGAALAFLGGIRFGVANTVWLLESVFLFVGIGLVLASIWIK